MLVDIDNYVFHFLINDHWSCHWCSFSHTVSRLSTQLTGIKCYSGSCCMWRVQLIVIFIANVYRLSHVLCMYSRVITPCHVSVNDYSSQQCIKFLLINVNYALFHFKGVLINIASANISYIFISWLLYCVVLVTWLGNLGQRDVYRKNRQSIVFHTLHSTSCCFHC